MRNIIKDNWRSEFKNDPVLTSLYGQLNGVLDSYQKMLDAYADAEEGSSYEAEAEAKLEDKTFDYNEKIDTLERKFRVYVRSKYHIVIS